MGVTTLDRDGDNRLGRVLVLGGGAVGSWLSELLKTRTTDLTVVDRFPAFSEAGGQLNGVRRLRADLTCSNNLAVWLGVLSQASVIVLSLPETVVKAVLPTLAAYAAEDALIVETCSVKAAVAEALGCSWTDRPALGINPLFRPSLGAKDRTIAIVRYKSDRSAKLVEQILQDAGAGLMQLEAEEHDRLCAVTQTLTHAALLAFGAAVAKAAAEVSIPNLMAMAPPPFLALLSLAVRVSAGETALYQEIQDAERGQQQRELLARALATLDYAIPDKVEFERVQTSVLDALGPDLTRRLLSTSERLLADLH